MPVERVTNTCFVRLSKVYSISIRCLRELGCKQIVQSSLKLEMMALVNFTCSITAVLSLSFVLCCGRV